MVPRSAPRITSVRIARFARGSRNTGTSLAIASTPVSALQPAAKALSSSRTPTVAAALGITAGWMPALAAAVRSDHPRDDHDIDAEDEHRRRQEEDLRTGGDTPHVDCGQEAQHRERDQQAVRGQGGERGDERRHAGRDGNGDGEGVVDDEGGPGELACTRPEVGLGNGVGPAAVGVSLDDLAVGQDEYDQQHDDDERDRFDLRQGAGAGRGQHDEHGLGPYATELSASSDKRGDPLEAGDLSLAGLLTGGGLLRSSGLLLRTVLAGASRFRGCRRSYGAWLMSLPG